MENKGVLIGSIIFVFGSFILMIGMMLWESNKAYKMKELAQSIKTESRPAASNVPAQDYSMYKTKMGDEGREMVQIPEGPFTMGSQDGDPDEVPEHQVFLKGFFLDRKEVTQEEYTRFAKMTKRQAPRIEVFEDDQSKLLKPEFAAMSVSWNDALAYCRWAGKRLPTEAEWEFAARGGLEQARSAWGAELTPGGGHRCNIVQGRVPDLNTQEDGYLGTCPADAFPPNGYGLYNVAGNVWEWTADWFSPTIHVDGPRENPAGPPDGQAKVTRGGSYLCHKSYCNRYRVA